MGHREDCIVSVMYYSSRIINIYIYLSNYIIAFICVFFKMINDTHVAVARQEYFVNKQLRIRNLRR